MVRKKGKLTYGVQIKVKNSIFEWSEKKGSLQLHRPSK
jgi:hypothetical protein